MRFHYRERPPKTFVIGALGYIGNALFKAYQNYYYPIVGSHYHETASCKKIDLLNPDINSLKS